MQRICVTASDQDAGARADVVLGRHAHAVSRKVARAMGLRGRLWINDRPMPPSTRVEAGDRVELRWDADASAAPVPEVTVLAVTDDLVYVDKPAGVHTHRLRPDDPLALADAVALVHPECMDASDDPREGGAVHRLDHETSGVVVFARNATAWAAAHRAIRTGAADKLYLALCEGEPARLDALEPDPHPTPTLPAGLRVASPVGHRIDAPIGRGAGPGVCRVRPDGQPAKTLVWMLEPVPTGVDPPRQLCLLKLVTGRRHQARVHLAHVGLPIVGDTRYGAAGARRLGLHALRLDLSAVVQGQTPVDAPLPVELLGPLDPA